MNQKLAETFGLNFAQTLRAVLGEIVLHPSELAVCSMAVDRFVTIRIKQHVADARRCIGSGGGTFKAMQAVARCASAKIGLTIEISPIETPPRDDPRIDAYSKFKLNREWPKKKLIDLTERLAQIGFYHDTEVQVESVDGQIESQFLVRVAPNEQQRTIDQMTIALHSLIGAVAKANGWTVCVRVINGEAVTPQPQTAR